MLTYSLVITIYYIPDYGVTHSLYNNLTTPQIFCDFPDPSTDPVFPIVWAPTIFHTYL